MTKMYSKLVPGVWFELVEDVPDDHGMVPAYIHTPEGEGYTVVHIDTISEVELTVVPESVPEVMFVSLVGDPARPRADVWFTEKDARTGREGAWGYFPVHVERNSMIPL